MLPDELAGAIVVGSPDAAPLSAVDRALVPDVLAEARAAGAEVSQLEALLSRPAETPAEAEALRLKLAELTAAAETLGSLVEPFEGLAALRAEADEKEALLASLRASGGVQGLGRETVYPAAIPHIDLSDPSRPAWRVSGDQGRTDDIAAGRMGVEMMDEAGWVLAAARNARGDAGSAPLRPVPSQFFSCPIGDTWGPGQRGGQHVREKLVQYGLVTECQARFASPPRVPSYGFLTSPPGGAWGATTCAPGPRYAGKPWIEQQSLQMQQVGGKGVFTFLQPGMLFLQPNAETDLNTQRWLEDGAPDEFWVCVHDVETGWPHALREVANGVREAIQNPYVSAAILMFLAPDPMVHVKVIHQLASGDSADMARTLSRAIAAGGIVPGFGPVLAVIAPREAQRFIERATDELFFTVPGFTSLVVYAQTNKAKRDELRIRLTAKQAEFYERYHVGTVVQVVTAVVGIVVILLSLGTATPAVVTALIALQVAMSSLSVVNALYQAEVAINGLRIMEKQVRAQGAADRAAYDQAYRDLVALIAGLDAEIARLRGQQPSGAKAPASSGGSSAGIAVAVAAAAGILLLGGRRADR